MSCLAPDVVPTPSRIAILVITYVYKSILKGPLSKVLCLK